MQAFYPHMARYRSQLVVLALVCLTVLAVATGGARAATTKMRWSTPAVIDHAGSDQPLQSLACPSAALCVAGNLADSILSTTAPGDAGARWRVSRVDDAGHATYEQADSIVSLSCPTTKLCIGVNAESGDLVSSTRPTGGYTAWHVITLPGDPGLVGVACPTTSFCAAVDFSGRLYESTHPTGPASDWKQSKLAEDGDPIGAIACPSTKLCVVGADDGFLLTSTRPAAGAATFKRLQVEGGSPGAGPAPAINAVGCASANWCVAADTAGHVFTSTDPSGPVNGWTAHQQDLGKNLVAVGCHAGTGPCVTADPAGDVFAAPSSNAAFTQVATAPASRDENLQALACPTATECLAVGASGVALRSTAPATPGSWTVAPVASTVGARLTGVSCPTTGLCVAIDAVGDVLTSTAPVSAASWHAADVDGTTALAAVSCPSTRFCAAIDDAGNVLTSSDPSGGAAAWHLQNVVPPIDVSTPSVVNLTGLACASAQLCITGDEYPGQILTSTDPSGSASAWSDAIGIGARYGDDGLNGASCSSTRFCVTISGTEIDASTAPTSTKATRVMVADSLDAVACTSTTFCAAARGGSSAGGGGDVWRSTDPAAAKPRWSETSADSHEQLAIGCHARSLCVAVDSAGRAVISFQPAAAVPRWTARQVDWNEVLSGISCPSSTECVAVDQYGHGIVGRR